MPETAPPGGSRATGEVDRQQGGRAQALLDPLESPNRNNVLADLPGVIRGRE